MFEILNAMYVVQYIYVLGDELNKLERILSFKRSLYLKRDEIEENLYLIQ